MQQIHGPVHLVEVEAFVQLLEVVDLGEDDLAEALRLGRLHVGEPRPVDQRQLGVDDVPQLLQEIAVALVPQLVDEADDRRLADPRRPRELLGRHEDDLARIAEDVVADEARLGREVGAVRGNPLQEQIGGHRATPYEINATQEMNCSQNVKFQDCTYSLVTTPVNQIRKRRLPWY